MNKDKMGEKLRARLNEKFEQLQCFSVATEGMKEALKCHDVNRVTLHVKERGRAMGRVKQIDKGIAELAKGNRLSVDELFQRVKDWVNPCLSKIKNVLKTLGEMDGVCLDLAKAEHESRKDELLRIRRGSVVAKSYGTGASVAPRFLDLKK